MKNYIELNEELLRLKSERKRLEKSIADSGEKIYNTLRHPAPIIKETVASLATDKTFIGDLVTLGLNFLLRKMNWKFTGNSGAAPQEGKDNTDQQSNLSSTIINFVSSLLNKGSNNQRNG